jgi:uncharacterized membrane protein YphA (DoxX/SURF4 family)
MILGRRVYGLGAVALGLPALLFGDFAALGLAIPAQVPGYAILVYGCAGLLVLAGLAANAPRGAAVGEVASLALAGLFALLILAVHLPQAAAKPTVWVSWEALAERTVMVLGGLLAWAATTGEARAARVARLTPAFGLCLLVFGTSEFVYSGFTASLVPAWLPPSPLAWTYITGVAQIAAGLAILSGVRARLAAILLTTMYLGFSLLVHLPRVIAHASSRGSWAENGTNLVLAGAAWSLAEALGRARSAEAPRTGR